MGFSGKVVNGHGYSGRFLLLRKERGHEGALRVMRAFEIRSRHRIAFAIVLRALSAKDQTRKVEWRIKRGSGRTANW